jgi:hypothetical protein
MIPQTSEIVDRFQKCEFVASTPKKITTEILRLCDTLNSERPVFVDIRPTPDAEPGRCFSNVEDAVAKNYGEAQTGWLIWEFPGVYLTAERHALLKTHNGFVDLTPQPDGQRRGLFAPTALSPSSDYTQNRYWGLSDHPLVHRFVSLMTRNQLLFGTGQFRSGEYQRNDAEATECIRRFLALQGKQKCKRQTKDRRAKHKAERQRRRRARR